MSDARIKEILTHAERFGNTELAWTCVLALEGCYPPAKADARRKLAAEYKP